jgi:hypothetical protein
MLSVRLCRLGPASLRRVFWSLLGGKGGRLEGLTRGLGNPRAPRGRGGACLLMSRPVRDLVWEATGRAAPKVQRRGAPEPRWLGACLLAPGPWLVS